MVFSFALQSVSQLLVWEEFSLNKDYIINNKCENRKQPQKHCDGKCYLKKEMEKQQENTNTPSVKQKKEVVWMIESLVSMLPTSFISFIDYKKLSYIATHHIVDWFHPPRG